MDNRVVQPITITPEQIIAAAQKIAAKDDSAWQYTPEKYLAAVRSYLEACINDIVYDADWHANKDNFDADEQHNFSVDFADELVMPEPPEWAREVTDAVELPF